MGVTPQTSDHGSGRKGGKPRCVCSSPASPALPAQLLATLLIQYERLQGVQSSGVLIIFWFLCVVCAIIPFRSKILSAMVEVRSCRSRPVWEVNSGSRSLLVPGSSPLPLPGSQDFPWGSVLFVLFSTCCISAGKQNRTGKGGQAEDQCNAGEWGHWWIFVGAQGAVL